MRDARWSDEDAAEVDEMFAAVVGSSHDTGARVDALLSALDDAANAHRTWAVEIESNVRKRGALALLRSEIRKRYRVSVAHNGRLLNKPRMIGGRHLAEDGTRTSQLRLMEDLSWDELEERSRWYEGQITAYADDRTIMRKLLALRAQVPSAATPAQACAELGLTVEAYLAQDAA